SAQVSQAVTVFAAAPPPAPKPVLTLTTSEVHLMPGDTHVPPLECTVGGSTINGLVTSNDTSLSRIVKGVQNVTAPDIEGAYGVKYSCTSGGQTADNMPELRVISDGTEPTVAVNASLPQVSGRTLAPKDFPLSKVFACVDTYDPSPTMEANGGNADYSSGGFIPGDQFIPNVEGFFFVTIQCTDMAGNVFTSDPQVYTTTPPSIITAIGASPVYLMPGQTHDPQVTCTIGSESLTHLITSDSTISVIVDGKHQITAPDAVADDTTITYTCAMDGRSETETFRVITDGLGPAAPVAPGDIGIDFGTAYDPAANNVRCASDAGSPVLLDAVFMIFDSDDNEIAAITETTPAGMYDVNYTCRDQAGNTGEAATQVVTIRDTSTPSGPATALVGTAPDAYTNTPANYEHGVTCEENGVAVDNDRILFNPPLASLVENANNTVTVYCPDSQGETSKASNQTIHIVYDTERPVVSSDRVINAGAILGLFVGEDLADHISCTDNLDKSPVFDYTNEFSEPFTYLPLSSIDTSSVSRNENFPNFRCLDRAGNEAVDDNDIRPFYTVNVYDRSVTPSIAIIDDDDGNPFMTTLYLDRNEQAPPEIVRCSDSADDLQGILTPEGRFSSDTEDRHVIEYTCPDELGRVSGGVTFTFIVDETAPADPVGVAPYRIEVDEQFVPSVARAGISCPPDADPAKTADILPVLNVTLDSDGDPAEISTAAAADYEIRYFCRDLADNESAQVSQTVTVSAPTPSTPAPSLSDDTDAVAYLRDATAYEHGITCTENGADITDRIAFDPALSTLTEERVHEVTLYCPATSGATSDYANKTVQITVDRTGPEFTLPFLNGLDSYVAVAKDSAYQYPDIECTQDAGSPVEANARMTYVDSANATIAGITAGLAPGEYGMWFRCADQAGNLGTNYFVDIRIIPGPLSFNTVPESTAVLEGTAEDAILSDPADYEHSLVCRPGGAGTAPDPDEIHFQPYLDEILPGQKEDVKIFCLDIHDRAHPDQVRTVTIEVDTILPTVHVREGADYYEYGPRGLVSTGLIHPGHVNTIFESVDEIVDRFTCGDNTGIPPTRTHSNAMQEFDYQRLGDRITPQFIEAHTQDDGTVLFDVLNVTCTDIAGNAVPGSWILAEDRPYHPAAGKGETPQLAPVITINQFVSEVPAGLYTHPEGHVECSDYLAHELATNNIRTPSTTSRQGAPVFTDADGTETAASGLGFARPGLHLVPHACSDKAGFIAQTLTFAFVPEDGAPTITIQNEGASVAPGGRIPVSATCTDSNNNELETTNSTYSEFYSILHSVNFGELDDVGVERDYHVVFSCEDAQGREAWKSAKFTRTPAGPTITLEDYEGDPRKESPESALRSIHIQGTEYTGPGATCTDTAT
ncbi:MAG: hypothetical protein MPI93_07150, partial [Nitrosopumilus sp.]|nr:hypothetical protein [Nitrosopumilus sp.]